MYKVILKNHGIIEGSLLKNSEGSYSLEQYEIAKNNGIGLQGAIDFAARNNFQGIILPKGTYSLCYEKTTETTSYNNAVIYLRSNQTFDLNHSTLEMIYDSENKSPYHTTSDVAWKLGGRMIGVKDCYNSVIKNGELKGDIYNRSFLDTGAGFLSEKGSESTVGIKILTNAFNILIENMDIHGFMADAVSMTTRGFLSDTYIRNLTDIYSQGFYDDLGTITPKTGSYYTTDILPIDREKLRRLSPFHPNTIQIQTSGGYNRVPRLANSSMEVIFFDSEGNFITKKIKKYLDRINLPYNATGVKMQFTDEEEGFSMKAMSLTQPASSNITVRRCLIHDNHRGGISNCSDNTLIESNQIYNNGEDSSIGAPLFPDSTRYGINCEDSVSNSIVIRDNNLYNHFSCMLLACYNILVEGNKISNNVTAGVSIRSCSIARVLNNTFNESAMVSAGESRERQTIIFKGNTVDNKYKAIILNLAKVNCEMYISENVMNVVAMQIIEGLESTVVFDDNNVKINSKYVSLSYESRFHINVMKRNTITGLVTSNRKTRFKNIINEFNYYENIEQRIDFDEKSEVRHNNNNYKDCMIIGNKSNEEEKTLVFDTCKFSDSMIALTSGYDTTQTVGFKSNLLIRNSYLDIYSKSMFRGISYAYQNIIYDIKVKNSEIRYFVEPNPPLTTSFTSPMTIEIT